MSEENPSSNPSEGSIPPVEPIVADDLETLPAAATPTEGTPAAPIATEPTGAATAPTTPTAEPVAAPAHPSSHVMMPKWVVYGVVGVALAALGFGVGWVAKPDSDSTRRPIGLD